MKRNYLRAAAIALIALPEPFTTPIGITLLLISYLLPKRHKDSLRNLEELVRRYRNYTEKTGLDHVVRLSKPVVFHRLNRDITSLQPNIVGDVVSTKSRYHDHNRFQYHYSTDGHIVGDKIIHHVLQTNLPQYKTAPIKPDKVVHHTLKATPQPTTRTVFYSRLRPMRSVTQPEKVVHHSLNMR